jgi:hypothetical protein
MLRRHAITAWNEGVAQFSLNFGHKMEVDGWIYSPGPLTPMERAVGTR